MITEAQVQDSREMAELMNMGAFLKLNARNQLAIRTQIAKGEITTVSELRDAIND